MCGESEKVKDREVKRGGPLKKELGLESEERGEDWVRVRRGSQGKRETSTGWRPFSQARGPEGPGMILLCI